MKHKHQKWQDPDIDSQKGVRFARSVKLTVGERIFCSVVLFDTGTWGTALAVSSVPTQLS
eukprot:2862726-Amphidinium_carterae.2